MSHRFIPVLLNHCSIPKEMLRAGVLTFWKQCWRRDQGISLQSSSSDQGVFAECPSLEIYPQPNPAEGIQV